MCSPPLFTLTSAFLAESNPDYYQSYNGDTESVPIRRTKRQIVETYTRRAALSMDKIPLARFQANKQGPKLRARIMVGFRELTIWLAARSSLTRSSNEAEAGAA